MRVVRVVALVVFDMAWGFVRWCAPHRQVECRHDRQQDPSVNNTEQEASCQTSSLRGRRGSNRRATSVAISSCLIDW